jgi:STE24 endopeptidase
MWCASRWWQNELITSLVWVAYLAVADYVLRLPFVAYRTFVIEQRHGFNKQTPLLFATDAVKELVLMALLGLPFTAALVTVIGVGGDLFFLYAFFLVVLFQVRE